MSRSFKVLAGLVALVALVAAFTIGRRTATTTTTTTTTPTATTTAPVVTTTTTTITAVATCGSRGFSGVYNEGQGAAGTVTASVTLTKTTSGSCTLKGWPTLSLQDKLGAVLPSSSVAISTNGPIQFSDPLANKAPTLLTMNQGATTSFSLGYSDVPVGNESCATATTLNVQLALNGGSVPVTPPYTIQPCDHGRIFVSPFYR